MKRIYISNLPFSLEIEALEAAVQEVLSAFGQVVSLRFLYEGSELRPKGLCFVEMGTESAAETAIGALNGLRVAGHRLHVGEARPTPCAFRRPSASGRSKSPRKNLP